MKNPAFRITIISIAMIIAFGCGKKNDNPTPLPKTPPTPLDSVIDVGADVYLVGGITGQYSNTAEHAVYWKNGVPQFLVDTTSSVNSEADAIAITGSDVIIGGNIGGAFSGVAAAWKNGISIKLPAGNTPSTITAIATAGTDIYYGGMATVSGDNQVACYWKNGVINLMPDSTTSASYANTVFVGGSDVFVAGYIFNLNRKYYQATYWKNGTPTVLSNNKTGSMVYAGATNGTDLYMVGFDGGMATIWKNGIPTKLSNALNSFAYAIAFNDGDVYISGSVNNAAVYWKNGIMTTLTGNGPESYANLANGIALNGSNVFVGGGHTYQGYPMYWWDNKVIKVSKGNGASTVKGIAIVPH